MKQLCFSLIGIVFHLCLHSQITLTPQNQPIQTRLAIPDHQNLIVEFGPNGEFVAIYPNGTYHAENISNEMDEKLKEFLVSKKLIITDVEFTPTGKGWTILAGKQNWTRNVGGEFFKKKNELEALGIELVNVEFYPIQWNSQKAFSIVTSDGKLMHYGREGAKKSVLRVPGMTISKTKSSKPSSSKKKDKSSQLTTQGTYRFAFDWIVVYEVDDGGLGNDNLELYWGGSATPIAKQGVMRDTVRTTNQRQIKNAFKGEIISKTSSEAIELGKNDGSSLRTNDGFIINVDSKDYGYDTLKEWEENAELHVSFRLKEYDTTSGDDHFPMAIKTLSFKDAKFQALSMDQVKQARNTHVENIFKLQEGGSRVGVSFSFVKLN